MAAIQLTAQDVNDLADGVTVKKFGKQDLVLFKEDGKVIKACRNKCVHMGGTFVADVEDTGKTFVKCTMHGWKMDAKNMEYPDQLKHASTCCKKGDAATQQPQLTIEYETDGGIKLSEGGPGGVVNAATSGGPVCCKLEPIAVDVTPGGGPDFLGGKYAWCTCGLSKNQPWCDGSHQNVPGAAGPLVFEVTEAKTMYLCLCKATKNPPNCDGSHASLTAENVGKPLPKSI
eukprot:TRINITY_DN6696_c0_g1_i1.p1 TRINITY_DN6696_c0_g1~~TRINITY_DN6696_c0_g1_i1.p1  ORF type:complete len:230 (-),score=59.29 TRINITY_DN6696_c0_g1_i1:297-986(-)